MRKRILIIIGIIILLVISFVIPVKQEEVWTNDDEVSEVGHYEIHVKNIYGYILKKYGVKK